MERAKDSQGPFSHRTRTNIEIPVPHYPSGRIPTYGLVPEVSSRVPRIAHFRKRARTRIEGTVVLPLHVPAYVELKQVKRQFAYIVSWVDDPSVKITVPGTEILDYVSPRTLEDFEYGEWLKREQQADAARADIRPAGDIKKRGRPPKKNALAMLDPSPSPPRPAMTAKGPSLSTPRKTTAPDSEPYDTDGLADSSRPELVGGWIATEDPSDVYVESGPGKRARVPESDSSSHSAALTPESAFSPDPRANIGAHGAPVRRRVQRASVERLAPELRPSSRPSPKTASRFPIAAQNVFVAGHAEIIGSGALQALETEDESIHDEDHDVDMDNGDPHNLLSTRLSHAAKKPRVVAGPLSDYVPQLPPSLEASQTEASQTPVAKRQRLSSQGDGIPREVHNPDPKVAKLESNKANVDEAPEDWEVQGLEDDDIDDNGNRYYLVRWEGNWPQDQNPSWEPEENVAESLVREYERRKARRKRERRRRRDQERERQRLREKDQTSREGQEGSKSRLSRGNAGLDAPIGSMVGNISENTSDLGASEAGESDARHGDQRDRRKGLKQTTLSWEFFNGLNPGGLGNA